MTNYRKFYKPKHTQIPLPEYMLWYKKQNSEKSELEKCKELIQKLGYAPPEE